MGADAKSLTKESYFDFSNKGGRLKQFLYGNTFSVLDSFWVSVSEFFFLLGSMGLFPNFARLHSDKESGLVVSREENPSFSSCHREQDLDESGFNIKEGDFQDTRDHVEEKDEFLDFPEISLVSISRRYEFFSDNSIIGYIEEPKAASFVVHDLYLGSDEAEVSSVQEEPEDFSDEPKPEDSIESCMVEKMLDKSEDPTESFLVVEKKLENYEDFATEHVKEDMVVYEFMSCGDVKEEPIHENCVGGGGVEDVWKTTEESSSDDGEFIELRPEVEISGIGDEEVVIQREELSMSFEEQEGYNFDDDSDDDEFEHSDVIERLKTELRSARTGGLTTILEESETPLEELKPLKIDTKFELKDWIAETQKVYRSYTVKMRKLDVLDSQTMHSINLIKLKDSSRSSRNNGDSSVRAPKPHARQNIWPFKKQQLKPDPVERLVKDVSRDFETVYVGHVCLSWEILHWQYVKVLEFQQHGPKGTCQYNIVAGEFQLFQVLVQRFVENEPFQSCPRIENYLKNRRCFHNFLQVPLVRDDRSSKTNKCRNEGAFAITIEMLREFIQGSMSVFREFIFADKHEFSSILKVSHQTQVSPQDPLDLELLTNIRTDLQKKEKRLKEILRSQTCMVKKLKKNETKSVRMKDELLIAQVELSLVSRVTNMAKLTTEQLVWCQEKLNKINFSGRRIHLEPSFSLFPC